MTDSSTVTSHIKPVNAKSMGTAMRPYRTLHRTEDQEDVGSSSQSMALLKLFKKVLQISILRDYIAIK
jgi:hypothetical protein